MPQHVNRCDDHGEAKVIKVPIQKLAEAMSHEVLIVKRKAGGEGVPAQYGGSRAVHLPLGY